MKIYIEKEIVQQYKDIEIEITPEFIRDMVNCCKTVEDIKFVLAVLLSSEPIFASKELNERLMEMGIYNDEKII